MPHAKHTAPFQPPSLDPSLSLNLSLDLSLSLCDSLSCLSKPLSLDLSRPLDLWISFLSAELVLYLVEEDSLLSHELFCCGTCEILLKDSDNAAEQLDDKQRRACVMGKIQESFASERSRVWVDT